jgi:hypothetical protein
MTVFKADLPAALKASTPIVIGVPAGAGIAGNGAVTIFGPSLMNKPPLKYTL